MGIEVFPVPASGPSLAEITSAITTNAAPSSVTMPAITSSITTNAASSGVTMAAINTAVANNSSPFLGNWTNVATTSPTQVNSISFTGLSGYRYYRAFVVITNLNATGTVSLRLNNDSGGNYASFTSIPQQDSNIGRTLDNYTIVSSTQSNKGFIIDFLNANSTTVDKIMYVNCGVVSNFAFDSGGTWTSTAAINRIDMYLGTGVGNWYVRLLGAN